MLGDHYGNVLSTSSVAARDLYVTAIDTLLSGAPDMVSSFKKIVETDPSFALGYVGLARAMMISGNGVGARIAMDQARSVARNLPTKEASHLEAMGTISRR
jgi:hypothetical protein